MRLTILALAAFFSVASARLLDPSLHPRAFIDDPDAIHVPLNRRQAPVSSSSSAKVVNWSALERELAQVVPKYTKKAYVSKMPMRYRAPSSKRNAVPDFGSGLETTDSRMLKIRSIIEARSSEGLTFVEEYVWSANLSVGTPPQKFQVIPDTGSGDIVVAISTCTDANCGTVARYTPSLSSTSNDQGRQAVITYTGSGANSGEVYKDTVTVATQAVTAQIFMAATSLTTAITEMTGVDGFGMGYSTLSTTGATTFPFGLYAAGGGGYFAFRFSDKYGFSELSIGNPDKAREGSQLHSYPVGLNAASGTYKYWQLGLSTANVGGTSVLPLRKTFVLDTGSPYIYAPPSDATLFYAAIPGSAPYGSGYPYYTYPCDTPLPVISLSFTRISGKYNNYTIDPNDFNLGLYATGSSLCVGGVISQDLGIGGWVVGTEFMKSWYMIFDTVHNLVTIALPKDLPKRPIDP